MNMKIFFQFFIALLPSFMEYILVKAVEEADVFSETFDVEPGGETKSYVGQGDGLKCEFTYVCQGGTLEQWIMIIHREQDGHYTCMVERTEEHGHHSYIYFESFKLKVTGGKIVDGTVIDKDGLELDNVKVKNQYKIHKHSIEDGDNFQHGLSRIYIVISRKKHHEL